MAMTWTEGHVWEPNNRILEELNFEGEVTICWEEPGRGL